MKKDLRETKFSEMKDKTFEVIRITERLCELCDGIIETKERVLRSIQISDHKDYENLLTRSNVYDRAEVDLENAKIYFYHHDCPGDVIQVA